MVGAVAVRCERTPEIGLRESRDVARHSELHRRVIESCKGLADSGQQTGLVLVLVVVRIEAACRDEEHLALHLQLIARGDEAGNGTQLLAELRLREGGCRRRS